MNNAAKPRLRVGAILISLVLPIASQSVVGRAHAQVCFPILGRCPPSSSSGGPAQRQAPQNPPVTVSPSKVSRLDPGKFYVVQVQCTLNDSALKIKNGLLVKATTAWTESLWIAPQGTGENGSKVPSNVVKIINFATGTAAPSGNVDFVDKPCDQKFIISGTASQVTVLYGVQNVKDLSSFGNSFYGALSLFTSLAPVFAGGPLAAIASKTAVGDVKAVSGSEDALKALITGAQNNPSLVVRPFTLGTSTQPMKFVSQFGTVVLTVTPVSDIASAIEKDPEFTNDFYSMIDSIVASSLSDGASSNVECAKFASNYIRGSYSFGARDRAFILGYFAQEVSAGDKNTPGDKTIRLNCIGNKQAASYVVSFKYNTDLQKLGDGNLGPLTQDNVNNWFPQNSFVYVPPNLAKQYINNLLNALGAYSQTNRSELARQNLNAVAGGGQVPMTDISAQFWPSDAKVTILDVANKLIDGKYTKFGCFLYQPVDGYDAIFLALPQDPAAASGTQPAPPPGQIAPKPKYSVSELVAIEIGINAVAASPSKAAVRAILLSEEPATISVPASANLWQCRGANPIDSSSQPQKSQQQPQS